MFRDYREIRILFYFKKLFNGLTEINTNLVRGGEQERLKSAKARGGPLWV